MKEWIFFAILFSIAMVLTENYTSTLVYPNLWRVIAFHNGILRGTVLSPDRYRILMPFLIRILLRILYFITSYRKAFFLSYFILHFIFTFLCLLILYIFFKQWFSKEYSLIGTLFITGTMPITFKFSMVAIWSLMEVFFFTLGLLLTYKKQYLVLALIILLAALNRETGLFIVLAFLFANLDLRAIFKKETMIDRKVVMLFMFYFFLWLVVFIGLRYFRGMAPHIFTIRRIWVRNCAHFLTALKYNILFLGFFWIFVILGFKKAPAFIKRASIVAPLYVLTLLIFGNWYEVRTLMTLYPILIPLGLSYFCPKTNIEKGT